LLEWFLHSCFAEWAVHDLEPCWSGGRVYRFTGFSLVETARRVDGIVVRRIDASKIGKALMCRHLGRP